MGIPPFVKQAIRGLLATTPYQVIRGAANRFDAFEHCQRKLAGFGYRPKIIIDAGAHLGEFAKSTARVFPGATIHMIEPQRACHEALRQLPFVLHPVALGATDGVIRMTEADGPSTGVHASDTGEAEVPVSKLDTLFSLSKDDRAFLKMDLQGYELEALRGGEASLAAIEVILTEVSFFRQAAEPPIPVLIDFLDKHGFELFDIAALAGRTRDDRLKGGDFIFVRKDSPIAADTRWA